MQVNDPATTIPYSRPMCEKAGMPHYFIRKLEQFTKLSFDDRQALENAACRRRTIAKHSGIIGEGDGPHHVDLIPDGWAGRSTHLDDGRRAIISIFVPGDLCDSHVDLQREMEQGAHDDGRVTKASWWDTLVTVAVQREGTVDLGQRTAPERLGHLFHKLFLHLRGVGLTGGPSCELPLTQVEPADALGLSNVPIDRTLQHLRRAGLIVLKGGRPTSPDFDALQKGIAVQPERPAARPRRSSLRCRRIGVMPNRSPLKHPVELR